jgi:hypothetical protein
MICTKCASKQTQSHAHYTTTYLLFRTPIISRRISMSRLYEKANTEDHIP